MLGSQLNWGSRYMGRSMSIKAFVDNKIIFVIKFPKSLAQYFIYVAIWNQNHSASATVPIADEDKRSTYDLADNQH